MVELVEIHMPKIIQIIISGKPLALCEDGSLWRGDVSMIDGELKMSWIKYKQVGYQYA